MKKRLLSLFLAVAMLCTMSIGASANSGIGHTEDGRSSLEVTAYLLMTNLDAYATTTTLPHVESIVYTTVTFVYANEYNNIVSESRSGRSSAYVCPDDMFDDSSAEYAYSLHEVRGGSDYGTWSGSLYEYR